LAAGASTTVTILLPPDHEIETLWAWSPEPGLPDPHWFEFLFDGATGGEILADRIVLHLVDGGAVDADGQAIGSIMLAPLALARPIPPPPSLRLLHDPPGGLTLEWPSVAPNAGRTVLEASHDLDGWEFLGEIPASAEGMNPLPLPDPAAASFFRLRGH
jgi:hypothetical protein